MLRLDPEAPARQETRRRLVELYLGVERYAPGLVKYQAARAVADDLIARGAPRRRGLLPAGTGLGGAGRLGPGRGAGTGRRRLRAGPPAGPRRRRGGRAAGRAVPARLQQPERADRVLEELARADPSARTQLALARHFAAAGLDDRAAAALQEALRRAPADPEVLLAAAREALRRNDLDAADAHLAALPPAAAAETRARLLRGAVALQRDRPDQAIDQWRTGLLQTGGTEADLSWWLAYVLLQLGRTAEAEPLLLQYRRLAGGDQPDPAGRYLGALWDLKAGRPDRAAAELERIRPVVAEGLRGQADFTLAQAYEAVRDEPRALEAYRRAARQAPRWTAPRLAIARLVQARDPAAAAQELERGLEQAPEDAGLLAGLARVRWLQQARLPADRRDGAAAEALLERARRAAPGTPAVALARADYLAATGRLDAAVALLGAAARGPGRAAAETWAAYANGLGRQGRPDEALHALDEAAAAVGDQVVLRAARARLLALQGHGRAAREALARDPDRLPADQRPPAYRALGELCLGLGDAAAAAAAFERWALLAPYDPLPPLALLDLARAAGDGAAIRRRVEALRALGGPENLYWRVGRVYELLHQAEGDAPGRAAALEEAERLTAAVLDEAPAQPAGHVLRGLLMERRGRPDEAIAAYDEAVRRGDSAAALGRLADLLARRNGPDDRDRLRRLADSTDRADRLLAEASYRIGDAERVRQLAAEVIRGTPGSLEARVWQARLLNGLGAGREAEEALRGLIRRQPEELGPRLALLFFQVSQGRDADARATIDQVRTEVRATRPEFLWAQCYRIARDLPRAEELFREALRKWPDDPLVRQGAADFFEATGRPDEAVAVLRPVLAHDPADAGAARRLARLLSARPRTSPSWQEALALVTTGPARGDAPEDRLARARRPGAAAPRRPTAAPPSRCWRTWSPTCRRPPRRPWRRGPCWPSSSAPPTRPAPRRTPRPWPPARSPAPTPWPSTPTPCRAPAGSTRPPGRSTASPPWSPRPCARSRSAPGCWRPAAARPRPPPCWSRRCRTGRPPPRARPRAASSWACCWSWATSTPPRAGRRLAVRWPRSSWVAALVAARRGDPEGAVAQLGAALAAGAPRRGPAGPGADHRPGPRPRPARAGRRPPAGGPPRREPAAADLLLTTAHLRHFQGRYDDEVRLYRAALEHDPPDPLFLNNMAWTLSEDLPRPDPAEALRRIDEALRRAGRLPQLLDTRGVILTRLNRLDEAIRDLEEAAGDAPPGAVVSFHLARAYHQAGRTAEARAAGDRARAAGLDPARLAARERAEWEALARP